MNKKTLLVLSILPLMLLVGCSSPTRSGEIDQIKIKLNLVKDFPIEFSNNADPKKPAADIPSGVVIDKVYDFDYQKLCKDNNLDPEMLEQFDLKEAVLKFDNLPKESLENLENLKVCIKDKDGKDIEIAKVKKGQNDSEVILEITEKDLKKFLDQKNLHLVIVNTGEGFKLPETKASLKFVIAAKAALLNK